MEEKRVIPRRRFKHTLSLKERLLNVARDARQRAEKMSAADARDALLRKARETELSAQLEDWLKTSGPLAPE
jgi:hypothetical protein